MSDSEKSTLDFQSFLRQALRQYFTNLNGQGCQGLYPRVMDETERSLLLEVINHTNGNKSKTASILGIHRNTLTRKLCHHQIKTKDSSVAKEA